MPTLTKIGLRWIIRKKGRGVRIRNRLERRRHVDRDLLLWHGVVGIWEVCMHFWHDMVGKIVGRI